VWITAGTQVAFAAATGVPAFRGVDVAPDPPHAASRSAAAAAAANLVMTILLMTAIHRGRRQGSDAGNRSRGRGVGAQVVAVR
jgi:hypothetical protein